MNAWVLRVEGVNFGATIDDTNDLSTMRGGSLALLGFPDEIARALKAMPARPKVEPIFAGASLCAFRVVCDDAEFAGKARRAITEALGDPAFAWNASGKHQKIPLNYLTVVVDAAPTSVDSVDNPRIDDDVEQAEARNHARQFRQWTIAPLPDKPVHAKAQVESDRFENVRPATAWVYAPTRHLLHSTLDDVVEGLDTDKYHTSDSVAARRNYGRDQRQQFYLDQLKDYDLTDYRFTDSITAIAEGLPPHCNLPVSPRSKIAVFYADGNGFGALRKVAGIKSFSEQLAILRKGLLRSILDWYKAGIKQDGALLTEAFSILDAGEQKRALRFETLMWGGDELLFVLPAWLAVPFAKGFFEVIKDWAIKDANGKSHRITHAASVVIAHHKTPVRQLKQVAKRAADLAKDADAAMRQTNSLTFEVYESLAPPDTCSDFEAERDRIYGRHETLGSEWLAQYLALPGDELAQAVARLDVLQTHFPRSQIYAALRKVRGTGSLWAKRSAAEAMAGLEKYRRFDSKGYDLLMGNLLPSFKPDGATRRPLSLDLALIATLWDYFVPIAKLPDFTGVSGKED